MTDREKRLDALREEAAAHGQVSGTGGAIAGGPIPPAPQRDGYYGRPLLKAPVWTWEVPAYLFAGGVAGAASVIAIVSAWIGGDSRTAHDARWIAAAGAVISPALLISDLGRPARFLNMLRVFKLQSAMSVGAWTLVAFSAAAVVAVMADGWRDPASPMLATLLAGAIDLAAALLGLVLATYTGVLLAATAVPVWSAHVRLLPLHFGASSLGAAAAMLELAGHRTPALNLIGAGAAALETAVLVIVELRRSAATRPLSHGATGWMTRGAGLLTGPAPLALRLALTSSWARSLAAASQVAGSLGSRMAWLAAGRASTADPRVALLAIVAFVGGAPSLRATSGPDLSVATIVKRASAYVVDYEKQLAFVVADEAYRQTVTSAETGRTTARTIQGELFLTFMPADRAWIAIHDVASVDGRPVPDRGDLPALLRRGEVSRTARELADRNARFNIGQITRNFNEPTLGLLLLEPARASGVKFTLDRVERDAGGSVAIVRFVERDRPTLIRGDRGDMVAAHGEFAIEPDTGRVRSTRLAFVSGRTTAELATTYESNEKLGLWVPSGFRERYERTVTPVEVVTCEASYTNYRRFDVTMRIK